MKMEELVQKVSELYREHCDIASDMEDRLRNVDAELYAANYKGGMNITVARYNDLKRDYEFLKEAIKMKRQYCEGIYIVREMLMDLGFDTEIKE
jgi:hypothetical protein